ncbi:uncharacterized protein LOC142559837 [Dermacentor variabilis]|uniref:uncharacterized protein LOC142559837 n=1 Tax=Dermacentor variabilis TaxID=34621 RepID=UPI003F5C8DA5
MCDDINDATVSNDLLVLGPLGKQGSLGGHAGCQGANPAAAVLLGLRNLPASAAGDTRASTGIYGWCCAIAAYGDPVASTALASLTIYGPYEYSEAHALLAAVVMVVTLCILSAATYLKVMAENNNETWTTTALKALCGLYGVACVVALATGAIKDALPPEWHIFGKYLTATYKALNQPPNERA